MPASLRLQRKPRRLQRRLASLLFWDVSVVLAQMSLAVVLACLCLSIPRLDLHIGKRFQAILPESVSHFFSSDAAIADPATIDTMESRAKEDFQQLTPANSSSSDRKTFGTGSSKQEVLAAQGSPSSSGGNLWRYGDSEVYFLADRVVGWRNAPGHPLKLR